MSNLGRAYSLLLNVGPDTILSSPSSPRAHPSCGRSIPQFGFANYSEEPLFWALSDKSSELLPTRRCVTEGHYANASYPARFKRDLWAPCWASYTRPRALDMSRIFDDISCTIWNSKGNHLVFFLPYQTTITYISIIGNVFDRVLLLV